MQTQGLTDTLLVSISISDPDSAVMIVGRKKKNQAVDVINAFQGDEAREVYDILTKKKEKV